MLADVARNWRWPYASSLLLAPATDEAVAGAVPDPPAPKWPQAVLSFESFAERRAVDVADLARADRLSRTPIVEQSPVGWFVCWPCLVLAVRTQRPELVQLQRRACALRNSSTCMR